ncbi:MAG TPA: tetratricopeptide repeat protein [Puia sp.]|nr:tetratricopeptide repeat protein [Puia sp.]
MIKTDDVLLEADQLYQGGRYKEMIELLNQTILEESSHPEFYFFRGIAFLQLSRYDEAIDDLTRATDLKPDYFRAWQNRGVAWSLKQKYNKAIGDLSRAIELRPNHPSSYRHLGDALMKTNDYDRAIEIFNKAIELEPDRYDHYHNRGSAWRKKGEYRNAIADYTRSLALRPNYGRTFCGLGIVYEAMQELELASIHFKRAYFFGFDKIQLARVFTEKFPAPYIVKAILAGAGDDKGMEANLTTVQWLEATCKTWDGFLDRLRRTDHPLTHPEAYYALEAIVHYYMGDPITAYRIFDTQFDSDEHPWSLTLRDQYYLVLSAMDFGEPDNGLTYAIEQAGRVADRQETTRSDADRQPMEEYYAGQLFRLNNDPQEALRCFHRCGAFPPALYGKLAVYDLLGDEEGLARTAEEMTAVEEQLLLDGIEPVVIRDDMSFEAMSDKIFAMLPYYELREEIEKARGLLDRTTDYTPLEFHALLQLSPSSIDG